LTTSKDGLVTAKNEV